MYLEGAKMQACNYAENKTCYRYFSKNLTKIYRTAALNFRCMQSKSQWSTHLMVFFNHLMLVVTKEHTYA